MRDGAVHQIGDLRVDSTPGHVAVLRHGDVAVAEMVGTDPGRKTLVVDEGGDGFAETVGGRVGDTDLPPSRAPFLGEVVRVAQRAGRGGEDDLLLTEVGQVPPSLEQFDGESGEREGPVPGGRLRVVDAEKTFTRDADDLAADSQRARFLVDVFPPQAEQFGTPQTRRDEESDRVDRVVLSAEFGRREVGQETGQIESTDAVDALAQAASLKRIVTALPYPRTQLSEREVSSGSRSYPGEDDGMGQPRFQNFVTGAPWTSVSFSRGRRRPVCCL
jgi:hypothetical protein